MVLEIPGLSTWPRSTGHSHQPRHKGSSTLLCNPFMKFSPRFLACCIFVFIFRHLPRWQLQVVDTVRLIFATWDIGEKVFNGKNFPTKLNYFHTLVSLQHWFCYHIHVYTVFFGDLSVVIHTERVFNGCQHFTHALK